MTFYPSSPPTRPARSSLPSVFTRRSARSQQAGGAAGGAAEAEEVSLLTPGGGWSSIQNQAGLPYQPLGEPLLDFVFHVDRTGTQRLRQSIRQNSSSSGGGSGSGANQQQQQPLPSPPAQEEKEKAQRSRQRRKARGSSSAAAAAAAAAAASTSLSVVDPVRDLLALCTPRRADVLEASLAIQVRVAASERRMKAVRAGAKVEQMERVGRERKVVREFIRMCTEQADEGEEEEPITAEEKEADPGSSSTTTCSHFPSSLPPPLPFPHDPHGFLSDDQLGVSLMQAEFAWIRTQLLTGRLTPRSNPRKLRRVHARAGGCFPQNWNASVFSNLAPHPLLAWERHQEKEGQEQEEQQAAAVTHRSHSSAAAPSAPPTSRGSASSHVPPSSLSFHSLRYSTDNVAPPHPPPSRSARRSQTFSSDPSDHSSQHPSNTFLTEAPASSRPSQTRSGSPVPPLPLPTAGHPSSATAPSTPHPPAASSSHRPSHRSRPRTRQLSLDSTPSFSNPDTEYSRAVAASKYRRAHHNSPTSHWRRLQENVQQRLAQMKALNHMNYFEPPYPEEEEGEEEAGEWGAGETEMHHSYGPSFDSHHYPPRGQTTSRSTARSHHRGGVRRHLRHPAAVAAYNAEGQILRQVANTSWPQTNGMGEDGDSMELQSERNMDPLLSPRAELTLARSYANFDLAKTDLKQRLMEALALQDSSRHHVLLNKYNSMSGQHESQEGEEGEGRRYAVDKGFRFQDAERDVLRMRVPAEKERQRVSMERMENYAAIFSLLQFIHLQNGGSPHIDPSSSSTSSGLGLGVSLGAELLSSSGSLPIFEEMYVVEVLCSLADSALPLLAHHEQNKVVPPHPHFAQFGAAVTTAGGTGGNRRAGTAMGGGALSARGPSREGRSSRQDAVTSSSASGSLSARPSFDRASSSAGTGGSSSSSRKGGSAAAPVTGWRRFQVGVSFSPAASPSFQHTSSSSSGSGSSASAVPAPLPPPSLLLFLLCLDPTVFRLKEVRAVLSQWVKLIGAGVACSAAAEASTLSPLGAHALSPSLSTPPHFSDEEVLETALRMIGVDPREPLYSGRGPSKEEAAGAVGVAAASKGVQGAAAALGPNATQLSSATLMLLQDSNLTSLLDAHTKQALLQSAGMLQAGGGAHSDRSLNEASRPLSSVVLAPVSLAEWERKLAAERAAQARRERAQRAATVRQLTISSNAATRMAIGLSAGRKEGAGIWKMQRGTNRGGMAGVISPLGKPLPPSTARESLSSPQPPPTARQPGGGGASSARPPRAPALSRQMSSQAGEERLPPATPPLSQPASSLPPLPSAAPPPPPPPPRELPRKHSTGVSQSLAYDQQQQQAQLHLTASREQEQEQGVEGEL